jgi:hypothetical protein
MEWGAAVVSILGIIAVLLKAYVARKPERDEARHEKEIQQGRREADGDGGALELRADRLLDDETSPGDGDAGGESAEDVERRISQL